VGDFESGRRREGVLVRERVREGVKE